MNDAGATEFAGWTWRYEFGAGCKLRVIKRYEGRMVPVVDYTLLDHVVETIPYHTAGFGVKAHLPAKPSSVDLFDARLESQAAAYVKDVQQLLTACDTSASAPTQ